jgi:NAD(P)-dependent dehydrogenase (short-subunit alcohol dehydrogenase family)
MVDHGAVIVTGAGTGIGRRCAEVLADAGYAVAAIGRRPNKLEGYTTSGRIQPYVCDVRDTDAVAATLSAARADLGSIVGLVNAAGTIIEQSVDELTIDALREQFATNVEGTLIMIQACLGDLRTTRGSIVNFSSMLTRRPLPSSAGYTATKGAIEAMSRTLAMELAADGVRVNVVLPSLVRSDIYIDAGMDADDYAQMLKSLKGIFPLGRVGEPDDVAGLVRFFISTESSWMTGCAVNVDGGRGVGG